MAITAVHHHKFMVSDLARSIGFYRDLLGMELLYEAERSNIPAYDAIIGYKNIRLRLAMLKVKGDGALIALIQYLNPAARPRKLEHYFVGSSALALVVDDIHAEYQRLSAAGARFTSAPQDIVRDGKVVARAAYVSDPDGIRIELYEMP
ncbi:MAG: VOC family protein [Verrucomicrobia bacterium]|nr:VOC family protein [Verrucomicrobiota bacterium]